MPVDTAAHPAPTSGAENSPVGAKDRFGEELGDDARIWRLHNDVAKDDDEKRVNNWDRGLNNLALFVGLFSAVTTAFIIEAKSDMKPDYAQLTFRVLNATASGVPFLQEQFVVPGSARTVNCLWIASLMLSLAAAFIAIMGKDWIGMYSARPACNPRQWAEMRTYRLQCVEHWHMSGVIATAPVLLHMSLILFGAGLAFFISDDAFTQHVTIALSAAAAGLYLVTVLSAVFFSTSPFRSPATQAARAVFLTLCRGLMRDVQFCRLGKLRMTAAIEQARRFFQSICIQSLTLRLSNYTQIFLRLLNYLAGLQRAGTLDEHHSRWSLKEVFWTTWLATTRFLSSVPTSLRSAYQDLCYSPQRSRLMPWLTRILLTARDEFLYRHQRPHRRPRYFDMFLSEIWDDIPGQALPCRVAESLSWLSDTAPSPETLRCVIVALGDIYTGPVVAPHLSRALKEKLEDEFHHNSGKVDFHTFSQYVLANKNVSKEQLYDANRFRELENPAFRSEDALVALLTGVSAEALEAMCTGTNAHVECARLLSRELVLDLCQNVAADLRTLKFLIL